MASNSSNPFGQPEPMPEPTSESTAPVDSPNHRLLAEAVRLYCDHPSEVGMWDVIRHLGSGEVLLEKDEQASASIGKTCFRSLEVDGGDYLVAFTSWFALNALDPHSSSRLRYGITGAALPAHVAAKRGCAEPFSGLSIWVSGDTGVSIRSDILKDGLPDGWANHEAKALLETVDDDAFLEVLSDGNVFLLAYLDSLVAFRGRRSDLNRVDFLAMETDPLDTVLPIGTSPAELMAMGMSGVGTISLPWRDLQQMVATHGVDYLLVNPMRPSRLVPISEEARMKPLPDDCPSIMPGGNWQGLVDGLELDLLTMLKAAREPDGGRKDEAA